MNWPNKITIFRLITVPLIIALLICSYYLTGDQFFIIKNNYKLPIFTLTAGILFIIASLSDFLDGYIARKYNIVTDFGKFLDPIADKFLVNSVLILFAWNQMIPVWVTLIFILRDIFVDFIRMMLAKNNVTLAAGIWGKLKTVFQMIGLSLLFFVSYKFFADYPQEYGWFNQVTLSPVYLGVFFSLYSGVDYFIKAAPTLFPHHKTKGIK
ncbi:CDP-diacylglycerol--glycerol-3-phosphate 3-phosphatidyltransferase [Entomoplasma freundtii]|uniref:CDP-diacylglycerol--glycerol-3-phosphate 3-phosphatidyltransferase n=2 Tax=Entomoplasma freundtii TaxID=74700 RepID=A0A2K8NQH9_9MOLU|nr:CDP-diacylglycerol--glycerol-3-phosphate 3-phosphatidyltransferase [Entomoplasma freundtii]TDY57007.1 CDP-diacylglycerol--glycerol-3-phosphate 3-phosphatidyltransferase [Entomoplasma freundtii]